MSRKFVVLEGDQTGQELLEEALRVLDESVMGFPLNFIRYDLSLQNRRATNNEVVYEAGRALASTRSASKQPRSHQKKKGMWAAPIASCAKRWIWLRRDILSA
jgi:isocitrate/isopropylmalate dehydrogenase